MKNILFKIFPSLFAKKKVEDYETRLPSKSGICWSLPRTIDWHTGLDSRGYLERLGFTILGLADEMLYVAEPPEGWSKKPLSSLHTDVLNKDGEKVFSEFRKNDIMNPNDYRAFITEYEN